MEHRIHPNFPSWFPDDWAAFTLSHEACFRWWTRLWQPTCPSWGQIVFFTSPVCHLASLPSCLQVSASLCPLFQPLGVLRFHSHPQLLVPEQQFASGLIQLQPVNFGVVADGSQIVACSQVHWGEKTSDRLTERKSNCQRLAKNSFLFKIKSHPDNNAAEGAV